MVPSAKDCGKKDSRHLFRYREFRKVLITTLSFLDLLMAFKGLNTRRTLKDLTTFCPELDDALLQSSDLGFISKRQPITIKSLLKN